MTRKKRITDKARKPLLAWLLDSVDERTPHRTAHILWRACRAAMRQGRKSIQPKEKP